MIAVNPGRSFHERARMFLLDPTLRKIGHDDENIVKLHGDELPHPSEVTFTVGVVPPVGVERRIWLLERKMFT